MGVEEELVLIDPGSRRPAGLSDLVQASNESSAEVSQELFRHQIETSTPPIREADELGRALRRGRRATGEAAAAAGVRAVAIGSPPLEAEQEDFTKTPRYLRFEPEFGRIARDSQMCGMHVHVEIANEAEGVRAVDGIRPWLPFLTAISANSPYWRGQDTGYASWRSMVWGLWSSAGPREPFGDVETYREVAQHTIAWGSAMDPGMLYFDVRLSESYPTVEIRVADICVDLEDAVLVAVLTRALVESCAFREPAPWRSDLLRVAGWRAARYGIGGDLVHPAMTELAPPRRVFEALMGQVGEHLEQWGERELVEDGFERLLARGNGAVRQRRRFEESHDLRAVVDDLADATEASWA